MDKTFGARLQQARRAAGLSRAQAVKLIGWPPSCKAALAAFEAGGLSPTEKQIGMLLGLYGFPYDWLIRAPLVYLTDREGLEAVKAGTISTDQFLCWMLIDRWLPEPREEKPA